VGWWSSAVALQGEAANHREVRRSRAVCAERRGEVAPASAAGVGQEGERKQTTDDVSKRSIDDIETRFECMAWDEPGGSLPTGQVVSGMEVARAWPGLRCGTCEPVVPRPRAASGAGVARGRAWKREPRAAEIARGRVVMRGTGADRLVVAVKPGNAGGAKGTGRPGSVGGQPSLAGGAG
jgi:hypothetical protein